MNDETLTSPDYDTQNDSDDLFSLTDYNSGWLQQLNFYTASDEVSAGAGSANTACSDGESDDSAASSDNNSCCDDPDAGNLPDDYVRHVTRTSEDLNHYNTLTLNLIRVRLFDSMRNPIANTPYRITIGEQRWSGNADEDAWAEIYCQSLATHCRVEWDLSDDAAPADAQEAPSNAASSDPFSAVGNAIASEMPDAPDKTKASSAKVKTWPDKPAEEAPDNAASAPRFSYSKTVYLTLPENNANVALNRLLHNLAYTGDDAALNHLACKMDCRLSDSTDILEFLTDWHTDPEKVQPKKVSDSAEDDLDNSPDSLSAPASDTHPSSLFDYVHVPSAAPVALGMPV